jgi:two-component system sensor histidine kinase UhpB
VIAGLIADFERTDAHHAFKFNVGHLRHSYGDSIDLTVYRCVQEGVTNAARHAQAKTVVTSLEETRKPLAHSDAGAPLNTLQLSVRDDGHGYVPGTPPGLGLASMEERVRALGGVFSISRRLEGGTSLVVAIPVEEAERKVSSDTRSGRQ